MPFRKIKFYKKSAKLEGPFVTLVNQDGSFKEVYPTFIRSGYLDGAVFDNISLFDDVRQLTLQEDKDSSFPSLNFLKGCSKIEVLVIKQSKSNKSYASLFG